MVHSFKFIRVSRKKYCKVTSGCLQRTIFNLSSRSLRFRSLNKEDSANEKQQKYESAGWQFRFHPIQIYTDNCFVREWTQAPLITFTDHKAFAPKPSEIRCSPPKKCGFFSHHVVDNHSRIGPGYKKSVKPISIYTPSVSNQLIHQVKDISIAHYRDHISLWTFEFGSLPKLFSDFSNRSRLNYMCSLHTPLTV